MEKLLLFVLLLVIGYTTKAQSRKDYLFTIHTPYGDIKAILYDETPLHKGNFIKLTQQRFYDSLLFHRIIDKFMIQTGDPNSKNAANGVRLGNGGSNLEKIPAEFNDKLFHKRGAIGAARDNNPEKKSAGSQFYIVQGRVHTDSTLNIQLKRLSGTRMPTPEQRRIYKAWGGTPHLDGNYTVFGEVVEGLAIVDFIAIQPRDQFDRPLKNIPMTITMKKIKKRKIRRLYGYQYQ